MKLSDDIYSICCLLYGERLRNKRNKYQIVNWCGSMLTEYLNPTHKNPFFNRYRTESGTKMFLKCFWIKVICEFPPQKPHKPFSFLSPGSLLNSHQINFSLVKWKRLSPSRPDECWIYNLSAGKFMDLELLHIAQNINQCFIVRVINHP